ncbi:MAG TPA: hypothetical protein ENJ05_02265, partial [Thiotrichales bacterium]|nr:hypothetical protein [Thiotrichales bacterium]
MPEPGRPAAKRVWLLGDGQPGHESRSRGLLAQLEALCPLTVTWLRCELRLGFSRALLRAWLNAGAAPHSTRPLHFWYRMDALPPGTPDLILSAGGKTSFANAWLGAVSGAPNVFAGTLRRLHPALFHTVLTLEPVPGARNNLVMELLPTDIDRRQVEQQGAALRARQDRPCWLLLAGGDGAGYRWAARDWEALAAVMSR